MDNTELYKICKTLNIICNNITIKTKNKEIKINKNINEILLRDIYTYL
jgi:hypothetical protein